MLESEQSEVTRRLVNAELAVAIAQSAVERSRNPLTEVEHEYWRTREKVGEAAVKRARLQMESCEMRAPVAAMVEQVLHYEGEFVEGSDLVIVLRTDDTAHNGDAMSPVQ